MRIEDFKNRIENRNLEPGTYVFTGSDFVFHQYLKRYVRDNNIAAMYVEELTDVPMKGLFGTDQKDLYYCNVKSLTEIPNGIQDVWIKCDKVGKKIPEDIVVNIPKLEDWQIKDYAYTICDGVERSDLDQLVKSYPDVFELDTELQKLAIFPKEDRQTIFIKCKDQLYTEKSNYNIFDISNAVLKKDRATAARFLKEIQYIDVEPYGLLKLLRDNFRRIICIQTSPNVTPEALGISAKQFWAIKNYSINFYTRDELQDIFNFLSGIDLRIKSGELDTDILVDYMITYIMLRGN